MLNKVAIMQDRNTPPRAQSGIGIETAAREEAVSA